MKIKTSNVPKDLRNVTLVASKFYHDNFFSNSNRRRLDELYIKFGNEYDDAIATTDYEEDGSRLPTDFVIEFSNKYRDIRMHHYIKTIFHEMTHVKQYMEGRLKYKCAKSRGEHIFEGNHYPSNINYWESPWEHEAYGVEFCAYQSFVVVNPKYKTPDSKQNYLGRASLAQII